MIDSWQQSDNVDWIGRTFDDSIIIDRHARTSIIDFVALNFI